MRGLIKESGALEKAKKEVACFGRKARAAITSSSIRAEYRNFLRDYPEKLLAL
jgi:hypothetical protein